ncbi:MAG: hypothetical protein PHR77_04885 [Kiritimatiellae bacterium]|nr:hypothetical protein [Kiritimatiellia bacterium]MDD5523013.1 hypothetical protein [Kiritimatiellia bacterium]
MNAKLLKVLKRTTIVVICLVVIYTVVLIVSGIKLSNAYAALKKSGRPMTAEEIIPKQVPDKDNASLLYKSAVLLLKSGGDFWKEVTPDEFPGTNHDAVIKFLADKKVVTALDLIKEAADKPACRYDLDYAKGPSMLLPHVSELRSIARLLAVRAKIEAERGDYENAWKTIVIGYKTADALRNEPILISQLVRAVMFRIIDQVTHDLVNVSPPSDIQAEVIINILKAFTDDEMMNRTMDSERILMGEWCFKQPRAELFPLLEWRSVPVVQKVSGSVIFCKPILQFMHASYLVTINNMTTFMKSPYWEADVSDGNKIVGKIPGWDIFSNMLLPAITAVKEKQATIMARARITQTGLGLLCHKLTHNKFPLTLSECDPKFLPIQPVDPFSGKPLIYKQEGNGLILYSIGENMKDDGGKPEPTYAIRSKMSGKEAQEKVWDIVWKIESK